ncbi:MAG TPA: peptidoglycan-binding protein [Acidimicrobiia bacterium]|nr:peptidoglycan-binding protein [Acidimicrobiia bacterium]
MTGRPLRILIGALLLTGVLASPGVAAGEEPVLCQGAVATIVGTDGPNELVGTDGRDVIVGLGGDDYIEGLGGDDLICAGSGDDVVRGGLGDDRILGEAGDDFLYGDGGSDYLVGGVGDDVLEGGSGSDQLLGGPGSDELWGSACTPIASMGYFCRTAPSAEAEEGAEFAWLFGSTRVLRLGLSGTDVHSLQRLLTELGFDPGPVDGAFGEATATAVRAFQTAHDLEADGVVGSGTRAALAEVLEVVSPGAGGSASEDAEAADAGLGTRPLRRGMSGEEVAVLQGLLAGLGFGPGPVDGVFGEATAAAVRAFQTAHDLEADGVVGTQTRATLIREAGAGDSSTGGPGFDTCNSPAEGIGCESTRGLRRGAPWNVASVEEWRSVITAAFSEQGLEAEIEHAMAIVACESLGDPFITSPSNPDGAHVVGLFQHKDSYWERRAAAAGLAGASALDPVANARVAAWMVASSIQAHADDPEVQRPGWAHWVCDELLVDRGLWE